jgi:hypothetical protein
MHALAVGALGDHRVEGVGREDHARLERDLRAGEAVRVARPVDALVVVADHARLGIHAEASQQDLTSCGVVLDQPVLGGRQGPRLSE